MSQKCCKCSSTRDLKEITLGAYYFKNVDDSLTHLTETYVQNYIRIDNFTYSVCNQCYRKKSFLYILLGIVLVTTLIGGTIIALKLNLLGKDESGNNSLGSSIWFVLMIAILILSTRFLIKLSRDIILKRVVLPIYRRRLKENMKLMNAFSKLNTSKGISPETNKAIENNKALILTNAEASEKFKNSLLI